MRIFRLPGFALFSPRLVRTRGRTTRMVWHPVLVVALAGLLLPAWPRASLGWTPQPEQLGVPAKHPASLVLPVWCPRPLPGKPPVSLGCRPWRPPALQLLGTGARGNP